MADTARPAMGTSARIILSDWEILANFIIQYSLSARDAMAKNADGDTENLTLLSQKQIDLALSSPYTPFLQQKITAYALITRVKTEMNIISQENFKEEQSQNKRLDKGALQKISISELQKMQENLDELCKNHQQQWEQNLHKWQQLLITKLESLAFQLSETEKKAFKDCDRLTDLHDRLLEMNLEEMTEPTSTDFTIYLQYKTCLALQSSLSRRHLPHQPVNIKKALKLFKKIFDQITQEKKQLLQAQQTETNNIIAPLNFAKKSFEST